MMIDYVTVIYNNYDLIELHLKNFTKRFKEGEYRFIIIDNTPDQNKLNVQIGGINHKFIPIPSQPDFDGVSHGRAIDAGVSYCDSDIICVMDSDFWMLHNNIHDYVVQKFTEGYKAVGAEYNDGKDTKTIVARNPSAFENIPCCFGAFYDRNLAKADTFICTQHDVNQNMGTGFVEVGWRIRKYILDNSIKTQHWKTNANDFGNCFFKNDLGETMGLHYCAGSGSNNRNRWNQEVKNYISGVINNDVQETN